MRKTLASVNFESADQLSDILKSFNSSSNSIKIKLNNIDLDVSCLEISLNGDEYVFTFLPEFKAEHLKSIKPI